MSTTTQVTINPAEVESEPLPTDDLRLPSWARSVLGFISEAGSAGEVVSLTAEVPTMSPAEMADSIGISRATIMRRIEGGEIGCTRVGSRYRIPLREVERFRGAFVREMAASLADDF